ncbi:MAG: FtsW/RodA/SpoVE family cell cycle protein [Endomicrobia bacterium]|nr:FtsW/RodA/SpoVE family cell cycle protein [Endomicrobiia bacterium]
MTKINNTNIEIKSYGNILFFTVLCLSIFGCVMVYSTTVCKSIPVYQFLLKQTFAVVVGLFLCYILANINYKRILKKITFPLSIISIILLVVVLFFPKIKGAHRWLPIPFLGYFQPSELARFVCILITAKFLDEYRSKISNGEKEFWLLMFIIFFICFLILLQPDSGIPAIILAVTLLLLFISSVKLQHIIKILLIIIFILSVSLITKPFGKRRLFAFIFPQKYEKSVLYQIEQSILALSRGGMLGCGLGKGMFKEHYLPEIHTDFVFSTIGEELGFLIAHKAFYTPGGFYGGILAIGLILNIVIQAYFNIAVVTKLFLPKGIGLPFISYGGSSIIVHFLSIGIILSISKHNK